MCAALFYVWWNLPREQVSGSGEVPQPTVAISSEKIGKVQLLRAFYQHALVTSLAWSSEGRRLAAAGTLSDYDRGEIKNPETLKLWDLTTGRELYSFPGQPDAVNSVAFSPDGQLLAAGSEEGITIWKVADGSKLVTLAEPQEGALPFDPGVEHVAFSSDGLTIAAAAHDAIKLWDVASGRKLKTFDGYSDY